MFKSKSEITENDFECKDIEGKLYLWTPKQGIENSSNPKRLIITAHGMRRTCSSFPIEQDVTLNFYSEDKNSVQDPGLRKFYEGKAKPAEVLKKGANCYNYILSKYTNSSKNTSHNKNSESYQGINNLMKEDYFKRGSDLLENISSLHADGKLAGGIYELNRKEAMKSIFLKKAAILTIRHRKMKADVNLKWVLRTLKAKGYQFSVVDCLFCRNTLWSGFVGSLPVGKSYSDAVSFN